MIILYPSAESETGHLHWPWLTMLFCLFAAIGAFQFKMDQLGYHTLTYGYKDQIQQVLENASRDGRISMDEMLRAQANLDVLGEPNAGEIYPAGAIENYVYWQEALRPHQQLAEAPMPEKLWLFLAWPGLLWWLVAALLLVPLGFLTEHLFSILFTIPLLALCAIAALLGPDSALQNLWLPQHQAWLALLLSWAWLPVFVAPWSRIELTLKFWFARNSLFDFEVPIALFALALSIWVLASPAAQQELYTLEPLKLAGPIVFAVLLSLPLRILPRKTRAPKVGKLKGDDAKRGEVERLFAEEQPVEAERLLRELSRSASTPKDHAWLANTAWRHDLSEMAGHHYRQYLNQIYSDGEVERAVPIVEEMMQRNIMAPPSVLLEVFDYALARHRLKLAGKVLDHYRAHDKVSPGEALAATEQYGETLLMGDKPDKPSMVALKDWLEAHEPGHPLIDNVIKRLQSMAGDISLGGNYGKQRIHKHVEVDIHSITPNHVEVRIKGRQDRQRIPWTAVSALYGYCVVSHTQGLYGCLVINFRNKLFACHFGRRNVFMTNDAGKPMSFEGAWDRLYKETPEDLPRMEIEGFQQFIRPEDSETAVEQFVADKLPVGF